MADPLLTVEDVGRWLNESKDWDGITVGEETRDYRWSAWGWSYAFRASAIEVFFNERERLSA